MRALLFVLAVSAVAWLAYSSAPPVDVRTEAGAATAGGGVRQADSLLEAWVGAERIPGAVVLATRRGDVVWQESYGWAQLYDYGTGQYGRGMAGRRSPVPSGDAPSEGPPERAGLERLAEPRAMTEATVFDLASVTKVMATTMAVMILADRGVLDVDEPVHAYLPDFRGGGKDRITLRHLLTHRSGLHQWKPIYYAAAHPDEAYAYIRDLPLAWEVDEGRHYSDLGFMLLGRVVERATGMRLGAFLQEHLYGPLGLRAIGFRTGAGDAAAHDPADPAAGTATESVAATSHGNPYEYRMVHDSTFGYLYDGDPSSWTGWRERTLVGEVNDGNAYHAFGGESGHAGLFASAADLEVLVQLLLGGGTHAGRRLIDPDVVEMFLSPQMEGQALGWQVPDYAPPGSFVHTGFTGTFVLGVPSRGLAVVLLTNRQNVGLDGEGRLPDLSPLQRDVVAALLEG